MKRITHLLAYAIILSAGLSSCKKEISTPQPIQPDKENCLLTDKANIFVSEAMAEEIEKTGMPLDYSMAGIVRLERLFPDAGKWEEVHRREGLHRWYAVTIDNAVLSTKTGLENGHKLRGVEEFETIRKRKLTASDIKGFPFNDPHGKRYQWHILNDGMQWPGYKKGADINVVNVYTEYTGGSKDVIVAVVDTGIDPEHPDLAGVVLPAGKGGSRNFVTNTYTFDPGDHGTHVAGIIGAINNNGIGGCGVAGGTDGKGGVRIMSCTVFGSNDKQGNFESAIVYAADNGALICNNSWGDQYDTEEQAKNGTLPKSLKQAIDYFIAHAGCDQNGNQIGLMKGGLVVFAAGNDAWRYGQPASYSEVVAVGAIGPDGRRTSYSNYGSWVDICAPGGEADRFKGGAAADGSSYILSTAPNGKYIFMCGTSQACPAVSGVAALIVSSKGGPGFTCNDLKESLLNAATNDLVPESDQIGPLVNAYGSIKYGNITPEVTEGAKDYISGGSCTTDKAEAVISNPDEVLILDANKIFLDQDGDELTYSFSCSNDGLVEFSTIHNVFYIKAKKRGTGTCTIVATDPCKAHTEIEFEIGVFDDSNGPVIYPNPVVNEYFMVGIGSRKNVKVQLFNATGTLIVETEAESSVFKPLRIDMPKFAAGRYTVKTSYEGKTYKTDIVKL